MQRRWSETRLAGRLRAARAHALLGGLSFLSIFPLYWAVVTSLRPENDIFSTRLWPETPSLENYARLLREIPFGAILANTAIMATSITVLQLVTAIPAAYAIARWPNRYTKALTALLVVTWLVPAQVIMVPNFVLVTRLGLLDTLAALVIPNAASAFAIMLLCQSMQAFPREVIEAARIDGAGEWRILLRLMLPALRASIASLAILLFITAWNEYFWPLLVLRSLDQAVIQIGLQMFMTSEGNHWGPLMAAATLACLPILAIYALLQRQIVNSFTRSGLK